MQINQLCILWPLSAAACCVLSGVVLFYSAVLFLSRLWLSKRL